jgi:hypothetical protein
VLEHLGEDDQPVAADLRRLAVGRLGQVPVEVALTGSRRGQPVGEPERVDGRIFERLPECQRLKRGADVEDPQPAAFVPR